MSDNMRGLEAWLPTPPPNAERQPTPTHTLRGADGYFYDPTKLDGYLAEQDSFWSVAYTGSFLSYAQLEMDDAIKSLSAQLAKDIYGSGDKP